MPSDGAKQRHHVATDERLAAGDPDLARPEANKSGAQAFQLLERQDVPLGQEIHVLGHAIDAAIVASIGHRHPHIGDLTTERIDERGRGAGEKAFIANT